MMDLQCGGQTSLFYTGPSSGEGYDALLTLIYLPGYL
jgi:hypothetical protein